AVERVGDIFDSTPEVVEDQKEDLLEVPTLNGNIRFDNVSFRYEEDAKDNIIQNINLDISAGHKIAFVGSSGSGKSTLTKLIYGFYQPNSGELTIDGFDLRDCWLPSLRRHIGIVMQHDFLFDGTIRENLALSRPGAKFSDIVTASKAAAAHEFIMSLPGGYETEVKDKGANFSGGQRQRICLARTLLQDPQILILDEATSALDNESEKFIINNINRQFKDRTVISIGHRLSTIKHCDLIYVIDKGIIIEKGTHDELMAERGMYYLLNARQS
ncbi:MAG: ATP-binding cassette domain-containing protein, partial [Deltaproteobacteria bacterium]|nr:ATP-binding cassette domain-containing protein [Deltaproteobacteria bacterium]